MLEVKDLEVYYGAIHAVKGISLRVEDGQIVTLIGSNGAGKSTTLHTISGLIKPRSGNILFDGTDITGTPAHKIVASGLVQVPEGRHVFANMSVMENLDMGAYLRKDKDGIEKDKKKVFELFPRLFERKNQLSGTLSGGEQQMLAMGRALMERPVSSCWMNRPWALPRFLSRKSFPSSRPSTRKARRSSSSEQNANMALSIADYAYVLETGRITLSGPAADLSASEAVRKAYLGG